MNQTLLNYSEKELKNIRKEEYILIFLIGEELNILNNNVRPENQIDDFLERIKFPNDSIIKNTFLVSTKVKKITYESILLELRKIYPQMNEDIIKMHLKESFNSWLVLFPEFVENCSRCSIMSLCKVFVKRVRK